MTELYKTIGNFFAFSTFFISWIYCIVSYGFLLGVGLGWLPSLVLAIIATYIWPLFIIAISILFFDREYLKMIILIVFLGKSDENPS